MAITSPASGNVFVERMKRIDSCPEAVDWAHETGMSDAQVAWRHMDQPQWMCWLAVRLLGTDGARAIIACVRAAAKKAPGEAEAALVIAEQAMRARPKDDEPLLEAAYVATAVGLHVSGPHGSVLIAAGYSAHCVHKLQGARALADKLDKTDAEKKERKRLLLRGCAHAAEAALHVMLAAPALEDSLPELIRANVDERAIVKAFNAVRT